MSPLWALPLIVLASGLAAVAVVARHAAAVAAELRVDVVDLRSLAGEIDALRADAQGLGSRRADPRRAPGAPRRPIVAPAPSGAAAHALGTRIDR